MSDPTRPAREDYPYPSWPMYDAMCDEIDTLRRQLAEANKLIAGGMIAFQLTREYLGEDALPAIEGWSWFDWITRAEAWLVPAADYGTETR